MRHAMHIACVMLCHNFACCAIILQCSLDSQQLKLIYLKSCINQMLSM